MREYLKKLPKEIQDLIALAAQVSKRNNLPAYVVGGFVRDLILGQKNLDLDIVVEGDGIKFAQELAAVLKAKLIRHPRFGTATLMPGHHLKIDLASAREECYPEPACLPSVSAGTIKDDLKRRDFTINAMAVSINKEDFGRLIDFYGGQNDLLSKKIRILHALSFIDDPTRILRAIRFEQRFGFKLEAKTLSLLKQAVEKGMLNKTQPQRLRDELILILKEIYPIRQLRRLQALAGFDFLSPRLCLSTKTFRLLNAIERQINHFHKNYLKRRPLDIWLVYFLGLTDSLSAHQARVVCKRYALTAGEEKRIISYKRITPKFIKVLSSDKIKPAKIFSLLEPLSYEVILALRAKYENANLGRNIADFLEIYNGMRLSIRGEDLKKMGVSPGPYYKKIFTRVLNAKLNGLVKTRDDELRLIKELI